MKEWLCPNCNHMDRSRVNAINGWKVQCGDSHCQRVYIVGEVFYEPVPGVEIPPADHIMPARSATGRGIRVSLRTGSLQAPITSEMGGAALHVIEV